MKDLIDEYDLVKDLQMILSEGRSRTWVAKQTGMSRASISRIADGKQKNLTKETVEAISGLIEKLGRGNIEEMAETMELLKQWIADLREERRVLKKEIEDLKMEIKAIHTKQGRKIVNGKNREP